MIEKGNSLEQYRTEAGLSRLQLSQRSGVSVREIVRIELEGVDPKFGTACKLAKALGLEITQVFHC